MVLLVLGVASIGLIVATDRISRSMRQASLYIDIVHEMEIELSKAHLALEDKLRGIQDHDLALVWQGIDRTEEMALAVLNGGRTLHGHQIKPLSDDSLRRDIESLRSLVVRFRDLARNSYENKTLLLQMKSMDRVFHQFLEKAFILDEQLEEHQAKDEQRSKQLIILILISWTGIISVAVTGLWYREVLGKRMQAAILNAKHQWEHTFDVIPDLIAVIDKDHRIVRVNMAMAEKMGLDPKDMLGRKCYELFHKTPGPIESCPHARLLHDNQEHAVEIYEKEFDAHFLVSVSPLLDEHGALIGSVHVARDITAQKRDAEALKESEERYSLALYALNEGLWDWHVPSGSAYFSPKYYSLLEYEDREFPATYASWRLLVHPEDLDQVEEELRQSVASGRGFTIDFRMKLKYGRWLWISARGRVVKRDAEGKALRMVGTLSDITERKQTERELESYRTELESLVDQRTKELASANEHLRMEVLGHEHTAEALKLSESRFRRLSQEFNILLDAIPDSLVLLSPDLKVKWANKSARHALVSAETQHSDYCYTLWHNQNRPCDVCPVLKSFQSGSPEECQISTPDNRLWAVRTYPIRDEHGQIESVMELSTDITEKKIIQAEQMRANHLASIGELAAGVAHEINNPINGIINYAQIIVNSAGPDNREYDIAKRIIKEGERISFIVTSLLSFARERKEDKIPISVQQVLADALALTGTQLKKSGIDLRLDLGNDIPLIKVHAQQIQQVFLNIINNARYALSQKYPQSDPDKIILITTGEALINNEPFVQVVFEDHGIGIPNHMIDKVMNPFYTTKPVGLGTGLGLSISHGIIVDHHGRLSVESKEGAYTRIIVSLPAYKEVV